MWLTHGLMGRLELCAVSACAVVTGEFFWDVCDSVCVHVIPAVVYAGMLPQEFRSAGVSIQHLLHSFGWFGVEVV